MKSLQSGFAHAFLIIGLVVAFIGALCFVYWQNFIYEPSPALSAKVTDTSVEKPASGSDLSVGSVKQVTNNLYATYKNKCKLMDFNSLDEYNKCVIDSIRPFVSANFQSKLDAYRARLPDEGVKTDPILCRANVAGPAPTYTVKGISITQGEAVGKIDMTYSGTNIDGTYVINFTAVSQDGSAKIDTIACPSLPN